MQFSDHDGGAESSLADLRLAEERCQVCLDIYKHIYTHIHVCIYIYTYMFICC